MLFLGEAEADRAILARTTRLISGCAPAPSDFPSYFSYELRFPTRADGRAEGCASATDDALSCLERAHDARITGVSLPGASPMLELVWETERFRAICSPGGSRCGTGTRTGREERYCGGFDDHSGAGSSLKTNRHFAEGDIRFGGIVRAGAGPLIDVSKPSGAKAAGLQLADFRNRTGSTVPDQTLQQAVGGCDPRLQLGIGLAPELDEGGQVSH